MGHKMASKDGWVKVCVENALQ